MRTATIRLYTYVVEILIYNTTEAGIKGPRKALADSCQKFRVIARNAAEAEKIGCDLARLGGAKGELLASATCKGEALQPAG